MQRVRTDGAQVSAEDREAPHEDHEDHGDEDDGRDDGCAVGAEVGFMSVFGVSVFALVVVFLGGVVTGAALVFFARGPVIAWCRVNDDPPVDPTFVEVLAPAPERSGRLRQHGPWERVAGRPATYVVPSPPRRRLPRGGAR